jgi:hypothetical protein
VVAQLQLITFQNFQFLDLPDINTLVYYKMPDGRITKYVPGRGLIVVGFKVPDARVNYIYTPDKGLCPVQTGQSKNAKETITSCCPSTPFQPNLCFIDPTMDGGLYSDELPRYIVDGGTLDQEVTCFINAGLILAT